MPTVKQAAVTVNVASAVTNLPNLTKVAFTTTVTGDAISAASIAFTYYNPLTKAEATSTYCLSAVKSFTTTDIWQDSTDLPLRDH